MMAAPIRGLVVKIVRKRDILVVKLTGLRID